MIGFCTVKDIRNSNVAFTPDEIGSSLIQERIEQAEECVMVDLSGIYSEAQLTAFVGSIALKQLTIFKTMEITLVKMYGATREVDKVDDVVYWSRRYTAMLKNVLDGMVKISVGGVDESPVNCPVVSNTNPDGTTVEQIYTDRGLEGYEQS